MDIAKLKTPVLFMTFNRMESMKKVFFEIRKVKPSRLFVSSDGPRNNNERKKINLIRKFILDNIDWDCEVKTLFRNKNLGCKLSCVGAIDWFFENVQMGIILEDDCLPNQNFFYFCQELLIKYENNKKIMHIAGSNPLRCYESLDSYIFSKNMFIWGWATWRNSWGKYDVNMRDFHGLSYREVKKYWPNLLDRSIEIKRINDLINRDIDTWDIQWASSIRINNGLCITPKCNLIKNIGFGPEATHTHKNFFDLKYLSQENKKLEFPLIHPIKIIRDKKFEKKVLYGDIKRAFFKKIFMKK